MKKAPTNPFIKRADVTQKDAARELQDQANLGPKSAALSAAAGIASFEHLSQIGAVAANFRDILPIRFSSVQIR